MTPSRYVPILMVSLVAACAKHTPPVATAPEPELRRANSSTTVHVLGIPPGQLPPPGRCRVWIEGTPPGRQPRARSCAGITAAAPKGSWIVYRPSRDVIHVHVMDSDRPGAILVIRHYGPDGRWLRDEQPGDHRDGDDDDEGNRGRGRRRP